VEQLVATGQLRIKFGLRLSYLRKKANLKQIELAAALGVSKKTISRMERGHQGTSFDNLEIITQVLGVKEWQLFKFDDDEM